MNELNGLKLGGAIIDDPRRVTTKLQTKQQLVVLINLKELLC